MIDGAAALAARTGVSKVVVGATILSLGTTAPETFVSVTAAFMGNPGLALGNGVGSIIADTGLIFGLTVLLARPPVDEWILRRTGLWQIGSGFLLVGLCVVFLMIKGVSSGAGFFVLSGREGVEAVLGRSGGLILLAGLGFYLICAYRWAQRASTGERTEDHPQKSRSVGVIVCLIVTGLVIVIVASRVLVPVAAEMARRLSVPEDVIAATLVAFGTSVPELATAVAAIRRGHPEITVGNIVGADVLNVLFVIGASASMVPLVIAPSFFLYHFPVMLLLLLCFRGFVLADRRGYFQRWQGGLLLLIYLLYVVGQYVGMLT